MEEKHGNEQWFIRTHIVLKNNFSFKIVIAIKFIKKNQLTYENYIIKIKNKIKLFYFILNYIKYLIWSQYLSSFKSKRFNKNTW